MLIIADSSPTQTQNQQHRVLPSPYIHSYDASSSSHIGTTESLDPPTEWFASQRAIRWILWVSHIYQWNTDITSQDELVSSAGHLSESQEQTMNRQKVLKHALATSYTGAPFFAAISALRFVCFHIHLNKLPHSHQTHVEFVRVQTYRM
jgi:hypothetical protein